MLKYVVFSALGYFLSPTPAVGDFCILTAIGVIYDYLYQITFFAAIMVLSGKREKEGGIKSYFRLIFYLIKYQ